MRETYIRRKFVLKDHRNKGHRDPENEYFALWFNFIEFSCIRFLITRLNLLFNALLLDFLLPLLSLYLKRFLIFFLLKEINFTTRIWYLRGNTPCKTIMFKLRLWSHKIFKMYIKTNRIAALYTTRAVSCAIYLNNKMLLVIHARYKGSYIAENMHNLR